MWQHLVRRASSLQRSERVVATVAASAPLALTPVEHRLLPPQSRRHGPWRRPSSQHPTLFHRAPLGGCARFSTAPLSSSAAPPVSEDEVDASTAIDNENRSAASEVDHRPPQQLSLSLSSVPDFVERLRHAAAWKPAPNHNRQRLRGSERGRQLWDAPECRALSDQYDAHLRQLLQNHKLQHPPQTTRQGDNDHNNDIAEHGVLLLSSDTVILALKVLLKSQPSNLAQRLREWERMLGQLQLTPLTDHLSLRLLTVNAKAGQVGRVLSLLRVRREHQYRSRPREFELALHAIITAQRTRHRNPYLPDAAHTSQALSLAISGGSNASTGTSSSISTMTLDNPTRWLDAILVNLHERNVPLTTALVARMLRCYAGGYTGKAVHHFYRVIRRPIVEAESADDEADDYDDDDELHYQGMPRQYFYRDGAYREYPVQIQLEYHRQAPPFYKIPSQVGQQVLSFRKRDGITKLQHESDPRFSPSLAAAFAFADSIQLGAAGHPSVPLDTNCYNALLLTCVRRGALWRALQVLDTMEQQQPQQQQQDRNEVDTASSSGRPNTTSYNLVLTGLARVGDVSTMQDLTTRLLSAGLTPDAYTIRAIVDGMLNLADMPGAITVVQDSFNQYGVLPPYTTHLKIFELCLASKLVYEAKRHLYFIQQLWKWQPTPYHTPAVVKLVRATQRNTQLQRPALEALFAYFGERLRDSDFF